MALFPIFPIKLLMFILPMVVAGAILGFAGTRGVGVLKKQGVAWVLTALMIVAAIGIGYAKAPAGGPIPDVPQSTPPISSIPPGYNPATLYVRDDANVLSTSTENELAGRIAGLFNRYGVAIGVVTCNYGMDDLYDYALKRAEEMDLGGYDFIVVLDIRGDNYWLLQGADLVDDFTDDDCADYAWDYMEQAFAGGDYDGAVLKLTKALEDWYGGYFN